MGAPRTNSSTPPNDSKSETQTMNDSNTDQTSWKMHRAIESHPGTPRGGGITTNMIKRWTINPDGVVLTEPVVTGSEVLFVTSQNRIHSVDLQDGLKDWSEDIDREGQFTRTSALTDSKIIVGSRRISVAIERASKEEAWSVDGFLQTFGAGPTSPTVDSETVYYGLSGQGGVVALNIDDGSKRWEYTEVGGVNKPATLSSSQVFVVDAKGTLVALDRESGERNWDREIGAMSTESTIGLSNGSLFFGDDEGTVHSYSENGRERWITGLETDLDIQSPAITDEYVFVTDSKRQLYALDGESGDVLDQLVVSDDESETISSPVAQPTKICLTTSKGKVLVLTFDGERIREATTRETGETFEVEPAVVGGKLVVGGSKLFAFSFE